MPPLPIEDETKDNEPFNSSVDNSVSQPIHQTIDDSIHHSTDRSINDSFHHPINHSEIHSIDRSISALSTLSDEPASHIALINQSHEPSIDQSINQSNHHFESRPIGAEPFNSINQSNKTSNTQISQSNQSNQSNNQTEEKFPYLLVLLLCSLNLNEAFQQNVLWPFVPELVRRYNGDVSNTAEDGHSNDSNSFWAGLLASSYFFAQLLSSMPWGILSDKIGRRPVLISGCLGATVSTFAFGLSTTYWTALFSRFLSGLLSGVLGTSKTYTSEALPKKFAAKGLSAIGFSGGLGGIIGPIVGGYLAFPSDLYPSIFGPDSIFTEFPVLLPELVSVCVGLAGVLLSFKYLPESEAFLRDQRARLLQEAKEKQPNNQSNNQSKLLQQPLLNDVEMSIVKSDEYKEESKQQTIDQSESNDHSNNQTIRQVNNPSNNPSYNESIKQSIKQSTKSAPSRMASMLAVCKRRQVLLTTGIYGLLALSFIINDEMFSFFLEAPLSQSGLGFSASLTGTFLSVTGGSLIFFQLLIFPWMVEKLGVMETWWLWMKISVPFFLLFPFLSNIQNALNDDDTWILYGLICFCCLVRAGIGASVFTPLFILIGGACPSSMLGAANGLGQTFAALSRSIGPVIGGGVWSLSLSWGSNHHFAVYIIVVLITLLIMAVGTKLSKYLSWEDDPEQRKEFGLEPLLIDCDQFDHQSNNRSKLDTKETVIHME